MRGAGKRDTQIVFQRKSIEIDDHGGEAGVWSTWSTDWAEVLFGTGQERREAAQPSASQTATFIVLAHAKTRALTPGDRISGYLGADWNITGAVPIGADVHVTAVAKAA